MAGKVGSGCGAPKGHPPYPGCEKGGRPLTYDEPYLNNLAEQLDKWINDESQIWLKDFFIERYLPSTNADKFCEYNEKFRLAYKRAKEIQEARLFKGSLRNKYNTRMACFGLMNNHGWSERAEQKISGDAAHPFSIVLNQTKELVDDTQE